MSSRAAGSFPVISAWSVVSSLGFGRDDFVEGLRAGRSGLALSPGGGLPSGEVGVVPGFAVREVLGKKGTRAMDRLTGLALVAVGHLTGGGGLPDGRDVGLVLGTSTGSQQSMADLTRDTLIHARPYFIETAHIPNALANSPAAQCAIRYELRGPNATVAAGRASALSALSYGRRLLASGRARTVLCGAVEEYTSARAWWDWHAGRVSGRVSVPGEGCVVVRLDHPEVAAGAVGVEGVGSAQVLAVEFAVASAGPVDRVLRDCVARAVGRVTVDGERVWAVAGSTPPEVDDTEWRVLDDLFGDVDPVRVDCLGVVGDTSGAAAGFQLVAVLAAAARDPGSRGHLAVVTATDIDGAVGCAVLRIR